QHSLLLETLASLNEAVVLEKEDIGLDIVAVELNSALTSLGGLTGEITSDDVLDKIFGDFCVGK
ncbi:MAG: tRNA uridine-5-carboxymethylaminomethyl(34) synthesis GTPase MnmE, partial [Spirochaetaceae bacterium]|nr:tRNA uridine-5-carboxymethylaminomethyl(34) synthesis GTPase MnmE [Spirochaetaceae bacterium]